MVEEYAKDHVDYSGSCHCGAIKYNVKLPKLETVYDCDCSICTKVCLNNRLIYSLPGTEMVTARKDIFGLSQYQKITLCSRKAMERCKNINSARSL